MTAVHEVTPGVLKEALSLSTRDKWFDKDFDLQVSHLKIMDSQYRLFLNDGKYTVIGLVDASCTSQLEKDGLKEHSIITISQSSFRKRAKRFLYISLASVKMSESDEIGANAMSLDTYFDIHPEEDSSEYVADGENKQGKPVSGSSATPDQTSPKTPRSSFVKGQISLPSSPDEPLQKKARIYDRIKDLNETSKKWKSRCRVTYKSDIRTWNSQSQAGRVFNVYFTDDSGEICATAFNEFATRFHKLLKEDKVYYVSNARVKRAKRQYSKLSNLFELHLDGYCNIVECFETLPVPELQFSFTNLNEVSSLKETELIDVIGVVNLVNDVVQKPPNSNGSSFTKRCVSIVDESNFAIDVVLWDKTAVEFSIPTGSVVAFKCVSVRDFGGRCLSLTRMGRFQVDPKVPRTEALKSWYDSTSKTFKSVEATESLRLRKTVSQAKAEGLGSNSAPDFFCLNAYVGCINHHSFCYPGCSNLVSTVKGQVTCNRKLVEQADHSWKCRECNLTLAEPRYTYALNVALVDHGDQIWATMFDNEATKLMGFSAGELKNYYDDDTDQFLRIMDSISMKEFNFRVRARENFFNGESKAQYVVTSFNELDYNSECLELVRQLNC